MEDPERNSGGIKTEVYSQEEDKISSLDQSFNTERQVVDITIEQSLYKDPILVKEPITEKEPTKTAVMAQDQVVDLGRKREEDFKEQLRVQKGFSSSYQREPVAVELAHPSQHRCFHLFREVATP